MKAPAKNDAENLFGALTRVLSGNRREVTEEEPELSLFDPEYYKAQVNEPWPLGKSPLGHYLEIGEAEGLRPHPIFDPVYVREQLRARGGFVDGPLKAVLENREAPYISPSRLFEPEIYLAGLSASKRKQATAAGNPVLHFLDNWAENRVPFSRYFDVAFYQRTCPDFDEESGNPLVHYLSREGMERADANPMFHAMFYRVSYKPDADDMLADFIGSGHAARRLPNPYALDEIGSGPVVTPRMLLSYIEIKAQ